MKSVKFYIEILVDDDDILEDNEWDDNHIIQEEDYVEFAREHLKDLIYDEGLSVDYLCYEINDED